MKPTGKEAGKAAWKAGNMLYPLPVVMVSTRDAAGISNILTVAWTGTVCTNPPMLSISVRPERHSYAALCETGEFVVNLTTEELAFATDYCGVRSGRDVNKWGLLGLNEEKAIYVEAPLVRESPVNIECRVDRRIELGSHTMFVAKVLTVHADNQYLDRDNKFRLSEAQPIVYSHGEYFALGEKLGTFGYSVKKRRITKRKHGAMKPGKANTGKND